MVIQKSGLRVLEALSATGLRSIRYAKEVPGIKQIIANDLSAAAVKSIKENITLNNVEHLVTASEANAITLMQNSTSAQTRFDVIDLGKNKRHNQTMFYAKIHQVLMFLLQLFFFFFILCRSLWESNDVS